jgi:hypothetical protein
MPLPGVWLEADTNLKEENMDQRQMTKRTKATPNQTINHQALSLSILNDMEEKNHPYTTLFEAVDHHLLEGLERRLWNQAIMMHMYLF